jgi:alkylation response protein AidB-like acyl-CoA dehydrogenase
MSDAISPLELRDAVRPVLTDLRQDSWPIPEEQGRGFDAPLWSQAVALGWFQLAVPEEADGLGLGVAHLAVLHEELGRALGSVPFLPAVLATQVVVEKLGPATGRELLDRIASGDMRAAIALPQTHSSLRRDGDRLSGRVADVLFGDVADTLLLPVDDGAALAIVPAGAVGVSIAKRALVDLTRSNADVIVSGLDRAACTIIEMAADDWERLLDHAAIALAAEAVGAAQAIFDVTLAYLNTREQFGRLIGSFQALKHRMADWKCRLEVASALVRSGPALVAAGDSAAASGAKAYCCDTFAGFAADAIQLHGGIGFTWEHPCHLFLKRAKLNQQLFGSSAFHKDRVAGLALAHAVPTSDQPGGVPATPI